MSELISPAFNFLVLAGLLFYFLRKPVSKMIFERHETLKKSIEQARIQKEEAEKKYAEFQAKLKAFENESKDLTNQAIAEAETIKQKIIQEAKLSAARIIKDAEFVVEANVKEFKDQIRKENIEKAVNQAEKLIKEKLSSDDQKRIVSEYMGEV